MKGTFITFDGVDGCGKSTQAGLLVKYLKSKGYKVVLTREPGATKISMGIRKILLDPRNSELFYLSELFLYLADRAQHVVELIKPVLEQGGIVVCDRFTDSTLAYQGYGRGISIDLINKLNSIATNNLKPDLTIILDTEVESGIIRAKKVKGGNDRIEKEKIDFHNNVRKGYLNIAKEEKKRIKLIKIKDNVSKTQNEVRKIVDTLLGKR